MVIKQLLPVEEVGNDKVGGLSTSFTSVLPPTHMDKSLFLRHTRRVPTNFRNKLLMVPYVYTE